ncbi:MAG TPA: glycosyltransferase family 4 protein [Steroidobacteraceae bacterium]|nr:glycosyltransferase family 4 protein [Steroidobacteraceae bacterium]
MPNSTRPTPRVYWLTEEFSPPEMGGTGVMAAQLSRGIAERGIPTVVITRQTRPPAARAEQIERVFVRRISPSGRMKGAGWKALPVMLMFLVRLMALLIAERRRYDLVVASGMKIIPLAAVPICRWLRKGCIIRLESPFELVEPISAEALGTMGFAGRQLPRVLRWFQHRALRGADRVVAISQEMETLVLQSGVAPERVRRIANGINMKKFHPVSEPERRALRSQLGIPQDRTIVLFVGRLSRAKGVLMLIEAWPQMSGPHPELYLVIVGTGEGSWDDCEEQVRGLVSSQGLEDRVVFVGRSEHADQYMQAADVYLFASEYEGFGLSVAEALSSALPSVLSAVGAAPELVDHGRNGFLFPAKNPLAMIEAFEECLAQRARWNEIGLAAREAVRPYDLDRILQQYVELCRQAAPAAR